MNTSLTDLYIDDTYTGLLHAGGEALPETGQSNIYDGSGNKTAISIGRESEGVKVSSKLNVDSMEYPTNQSPTGKGVVVQSAVNKLSIVEKLPSSYLEPLNPSPAGTYNGYISRLIVSEEGLITEVGTSTLPAAPTIPTNQITKAYAEILSKDSYDISGSQLNFEIVGFNIKSITWLSRGLYRVYFNNPMSTRNYTVIATNQVQSSTGVINRLGPHENSMIVGFKDTDYFEFWCWSDDNDRPENMNAVNLLVFSL